LGVASRTRTFPPHWNSANAPATTSSVNTKITIRKRRAHIAGGPIGRARRRQAVQQASQGARNDLIGIEDLDEDEIEELRSVPESVTDPHPQEAEVG
jgi:hypothetical protein